MIFSVLFVVLEFKRNFSVFRSLRLELVVGTVDEDSCLESLNFLFLWGTLFLLGWTLRAVGFGIGGRQGGLFACMIRITWLCRIRSVGKT